jgi:ABC-type oligopeptide transport system substrate-binding subunit
MKIRVFILLVVLFTLVAVLPAQKFAPIGKKKVKGKSLHVAIPFAFKRNYDPLKGNYINLQPLFRVLYSTLFRVNSQLATYPHLVESYEQTGAVVTLQIKKEARFSDGTLISGKDAADSIEMAISNNSFPSPIYKVIEGGADLVAGKVKKCAGIKVLGPKRFQIKLVNENVRFAYYLTSTVLSITPRGRKSGKLVYSGPFEVIDHRETDIKTIVTLQRNRHYLGEKSILDFLYIHFYNQHADFEAAIANGEPELFIYNRHIKMPESNYKYDYYKTPVYGGFYFILNSQKGPFIDKQLRKFFQNFMQSLDVSGSIGWKLTTPAKLVLPHSLTGHTVFKQFVPDDWHKYVPKKKIKISCANSPTGFRKELFLMMKEKLKPYNVDLDLHWVNSQEMIQREQMADFDLTSYYYIVDVPLSSYFYEELFTPGSELNLFGHRVPEASRLLAQLQKEEDELMKLRILAQLERLAQEDSVVIPFVTPLSLVGYKKHVKHVKIDKYMNLNFEEIDVKKRN